MEQFPKKSELGINDRLLELENKEDKAAAFREIQKLASPGGEAYEAIKTADLALLESLDINFQQVTEFITAQLRSELYHMPDIDEEDLDVLGASWTQPFHDAVAERRAELSAQ